MAKGRTPAWLGFLVLVGPLILIPVFWVLVSVTARPVHPDPESVPAAMHSAPLPAWAGAVEQGRQVVRSSVADQNLPGLSVAVGVGGDVVWAEGFGWADIEARVPVTPDTRFRIGTASTVLTSAAVGVLLEKGWLTLDDEIQIYVPQFPKKQGPVTLRQLMAHVGGVGTDDGDEGPLFRVRCERPVEALPHFAPETLLFEPGTQYRHSKYGWILVSAAVEAAANEPFHRFMGEQIFRPLGMDNTGAESATEEDPERVGEPEEDPPLFTFIRQVVLDPLGVSGPRTKAATDPPTVYLPGFGYDPLAGYDLHVMRPHKLSCYAGSMAFFSTPSDLVRFGLGINSGTLLQPATVQSLLTPQQLTSGRETSHGLGWELATVSLGGEPTPVAGHDGELLGRRVMTLMIFREAEMVVAVMSNSSYADTPAIALKVAEAFAQPARR